MAGSHRRWTWLAAVLACVAAGVIVSALAGVVQNAFFKTILPGFQRNAGTASRGRGKTTPPSR